MTDEQFKKLMDKLEEIQRQLILQQPPSYFGPYHPPQPWQPAFDPYAPPHWRIGPTD